MPKRMTAVQSQALYDALPDICQFLETLRAEWPRVVDDVLDRMDLDFDAFDEANVSLCDLIGYKPGEQPDDD